MLVANPIRPDRGLCLKIAFAVAARLRIAVLLLLGIFSLAPAYAHVGSPDIYAEGDAGPYKVFVTVQPPAVIPGVAAIEVRTSPAPIDRIQIAPMPLTGEASKHPPVPDTMKRSSDDPNFYTGNLWIMATGSWQVRFLVQGSDGRGEFSVPIAAAPVRTLKMGPALGGLLAFLGLLLFAGFIGIVGAGMRDARRPPGEPVSPRARQRAAAAMAATAVFLLLAIRFGDRWWNAEAAGYAKNVYKPLTMTPALHNTGIGDAVLDLSLANPASRTAGLVNPASGADGWMHARKIDDFIPDHDHLMHLYLIREPGMDVVFHLHPDLAGPGEFRLALPQMPAGKYRLYADVVHRDGFPETLVSSVVLPKMEGRPLSGDDSKGLAPALDLSIGGGNGSNNFRLPDGYMMVWARPPVLKARVPQVFEFYLLDPTGRPPGDMSLYMGMAGHAAFVRSDGEVFAHIHPSGTPAMAAMMLAANPSGDASAAGSGMAGMPMGTPGATVNQTGRVAGRPPNHVGFPYGFPTPGRYRIFIQMKHGETIETGSFDASVLP